jgi:hypothetical protein
MDAKLTNTNSEALDVSPTLFYCAEDNWLVFSGVSKRYKVEY